MGQAIVYCTRCNAQLRSTDFDKGSAVKVDHKSYCLKCLPDGVTPPPTEKPRKRSNATTSINIVPPEPAEPPKPARIWVAVVAIGIVVVIVAILMSSKPEPAPATRPEPTVADPSPAPPPALPTPEREARAALVRLLKRIAEHPDDLDGQQSLLEELELKTVGTSVAAEVPLEKQRLARRREDRRRAEIGELGQQVHDSTADQARILLNAARGRHRDEAWTAEVDRLLASVEPPPPAVAKAPAAPAVQPPAAPPKPPPPAFPPGWENAMQLVTARDYPAALAALDASPDAALIKAVAALQAETLKALARTPRGQKIVLDAVGDRHIEGTFLREAGGILEIKADSGPVEVETGELRAASLVAVARAAGTVDPKTAAAFCLIDGDAAGAKAIAGADAAALPERFWRYAERAPRAASEPARDQYRDAVAALSKPVTAADGAARLQALLRDRAEDPFVRRNRAAIATRAQGGRDFVYFAEDLKASGVFKPGKSGKLESCWTSDSDVEGPKAKDNFLELEFSTLPDLPYKAWIYVGGCCQEVLEFSCQGTEMEAGKGAKEAAEPGAAVALPVKPYLSSMKKLHSQHNGPKSPARWDWAALPLPRYAKAGVQKVRILSDQKGFSVGAVVVSATRSGPPTDSELKELLRARGERPKPPEQPKVVVLLACALDGSDHVLVGDLRDKALYGAVMWDLLFTGYERMKQAVVFPERGEFRFTYFVKTPTVLTARIRVERNGGTLACDLAVPNVVVGTPTEARLSIADFKPSFVAGPNIAPGETARMFHVYATALDSGLRIDALSIVELKK
jgi:hypothetical protein